MKEEEFLTFARRMRAAGILLYIEEDDNGKCPQVPPAGLRIRPVGAVIESRAFDLDPIGAGYQVSLRITTNVPGAFAISAFGFELPWADSSFRLLDDPLEYEADPPLYRFPGKYSPQYERDMGINHCANVTRMLSKGQSIQGYLLAVGGPMPDSVKHGELIAAIVNVFDQFDRKYSASVSLWAQRREKLLSGSTTKTPRKRLHECPDPA